MIDVEKRQLAFRRLLLAKQLYLHGLDHSNKAGALNKMIAIHNFHNSIEIFLRAIMLHYDIRTDRTLNITFEAMLSEIANHHDFRDGDINLPYRRDLLNLNQLRNAVQHHAVEPPSNAMDVWRVFTRRFLKQACQTYFDLEFESLSLLDLVEDTQLHELLRLSHLSIEEKNFKRSIALAKIAFRWSTSTLWYILPDKQLLDGFAISRELDWALLLGERRLQFGTSRSSEFRALKEVLEKLADRIREVEYYAAILSSGIDVVDHKRFELRTPRVSFTASGPPIVNWPREMELQEETAQWVHSFVVTAIVHWQAVGLRPSVPEWSRERAEVLIEEGGTRFDQ